ncbi:MAG: excalibur calcium-binding domain-containing protein [Aeromicrobium sp.]
MRTRLGRLAAALAVGFALSMSMTAPAHASAKKFKAHGVGKPGAKDKKLYDANKGSDRDGDGIACEKL